LGCGDGKVLLAAEMMKERPFRHAGLAAEVVNARCGVSFRSEEG